MQVPGEDTALMNYVFRFHSINAHAIIACVYNYAYP